MEQPLWVELIGYAGSALVVLSLTRRSIFKLRAIGLAASLVFFAYALLIRAFPIAVVNIVIASVHLYFLRKLTRRQSEIFTTLDVDADSQYLRAFLDFHAADIARFQPEFAFDPAAPVRATFILRDMIPAGLVIYRTDDQARVVEVLLDYAIPQYRDFKLGRFLYSRDSGIFADPRYDAVLATATTAEHARYLEKIGFRRVADGSYRLELRPTPAVRR